MADFLMKSMNERHSELAQDPSRMAWGAFALAMLNYREGKLQSASEWSALCMSNQGAIPSRDASIRCLLAKIRWKQDRKDEAHMLLGEAGVPIEAAFSKNLEIGNVQSFWFDWVNARVLMREANSLVTGE